jgi:hypothetical protein
MSKPIALDICCRKGGATVGLQRAGFYVIGVDIEPQLGYPGDDFMCHDGIKILDILGRLGQLHVDRIGWFRPALIWQSWPCQAGNTATASNRKRGMADDHQQFIPEARALSDKIGIPYVLEQPQSSSKGLIRPDLTLCMDMFKGDMPPPWVMKHRSFEIAGFTVPQPEHPAGPVRARGLTMVGFPPPAGHAGRVRGWRHGQFYDGLYVAAYGRAGGRQGQVGGYKGTAEEIAHAMQIDWMTDLFDLQEAIPPAYSEYIGRAFLSTYA